MAKADDMAKFFAKEMAFIMDTQQHKFPKKFYRVDAEDGNYFLVEMLDYKAARGLAVAGGEKKKDSALVKPVPSKEYVQDTILQFSWRAKEKGYFNAASLKEAQEADNFNPEKAEFLNIGLYDEPKRVAVLTSIWKAVTRNRIAEADIKDVLFKSQSGFTWSKLDFDPTKKDSSRREDYNIPTWEVILGNVTNLDAFLAFIGSIFEEKSYMQQYCYMFGTGRNGKGSTIRFLEKILGKAFASEDPPDSRFWTHGLLGKRLVAFSDCDSPAFFTTGKFKKLTGGDSVKMEPKGLGRFDARLKCKFIIASNDRLEISGGSADKRRIIYVEFKEDPSGGVQGISEQEFENRLWDERAEFIGLCLAKYKEMCPKHEKIPVKAEVTEDLIAEGEDQFWTVFNDHFKLEAGGRIRQNEVMETFMNESTHKVTQYEFREFKKFLLRMDGVTNKKCKVDGKSNFYWVGITKSQQDEGKPSSQF